MSTGNVEMVETLETVSDIQETNKEIEPEQTESEIEKEPIQTVSKPLNVSEGAVMLRSWLNKTFRIEMSDGRILIGVFLCTDRDSNVILGSCSEYLSAEEMENSEPRLLGLVMIPGKHIVSINLDRLEQTYLYDENSEYVM